MAYIITSKNRKFTDRKISLNDMMTKDIVSYRKSLGLSMKECMQEVHRELYDAPKDEKTALLDKIYRPNKD